MGLKRQHIFDDILSGGGGTYHSAILTCYSFDPFFYSNFFKPQLSARGIGNQLVLIDASKLDAAKENERFAAIPGSSPYEGYTPVRMECPRGGVFHPKVGLFIGEKRVTAVVGSGNLTYSGMSYNDEAWCAFSVSSTDSPDAPVTAAVWRYLKGLTTAQGIACAGLQLSWMLENSALLQGLDAMDFPFLTEPDGDGQRFAFVANSDSRTVFSALVEAVGDSKVGAVTVCAPFYDLKGAALVNLQKAFSPARIDCLVHPDEGSLPLELSLQDHPGIHFHDFEVADEKSPHVVHAKLIQIETDAGTVLAVGSANASVQALGGDGGYRNDEADILILSSTGRDYLKELGINRLDEISDLSAFRQGRKTDDEKAPGPELVIRHCELLEDGFHISLHKGPAEGVDICLVDDFGKETLIREVRLDDGDNLVPNVGGLTARTVFLSRDGERVSNRCVVIIRSEVEKKNPDKTLAPIARLLESARDSADFEQLLQFVHIEEETRPKASFRLSPAGGPGQERRDTPKVLKDEDFDSKVFRNRLAMSEQINDQILERLARLFISSAGDVSYTETPQDETASQDDIDKGVPEEKDTVNRPEDAGKQCPVIDEARGYFRKLLKYYGLLSWDSPRYGEDRQAFLIRKPFYVKDRTDLSYSAVCIAVFEMCKVARNGSNREWREMMDWFVNIVGSYLLIYRCQAPDASEAALAKMARKHRNLVVFSLLLVSFWEDYGPRRTLLRLLTLNLLDTYRDNLDELEDVFREYSCLLDKGLLPPNDGGVRLVRACHDGYLAFMRDKDNRRETLRPGQGRTVIYRPSFGFVQLEDIRRGKGPRSTVTLFDCSATAPGFPENILFNKYPIRGRIAETSLRETAFVFEKD